MTFQGFGWTRPAIGTTTIFLLASFATGSTIAEAQEVRINEIQVSTTGSDWEFFELTGAAGTDLSGLWLLSIESDAGASAGTIDSAVQIGGRMPSDGFWWAASPVGQETYRGACGTADATIANNTFENSSTTNLLVREFSGTVNGDIDTDNDGAIDNPQWVELLDGVAILDLASDFSYVVEALGPDGSFLPSGVFRSPDAGEWSAQFLDFGTPDGTPGASNISGCVTSGPPPAESRLIHEVQGNGAESPLLGSSVTIQGVVIADLQETGELDGFFVQEERTDEDDDLRTSEGIFVYCGRGATGCPDVSVGAIVTVSGAVDEFNGLTQLDNDNGNLAVTVNNSGNNLGLVTPATVKFPLNSATDLEAFEGMSVAIASDMYAIEYFNFDRFSEIRVWTDGTGADRPFQPTQTRPPESVDAAAVAQSFAAQSVLLDDGSSRQNIGKLFPRNDLNEPVFGLDSFNPGIPPAGFRGGDLFSGIEGVLGYGFGEYRVHLSDLSAGTAIDGGQFEIVVSSLNPRPQDPEEVGGSLKLASFNVLNYFTTIDDGNNDVCGASRTLECRGADTASELSRQQTKLIAALAALDADIIGLVEIENTPDVSAEQVIVAALNMQTARNYAVVDAGVIGTDAIKVGFIYDTATVAAVGDYAVLDTPEFVNPLTADPKNRPALAQTFREKATSGVFTVAVNHLKSKGSGCGANDDDPVQQNCNGTREAAAVALANWLATDPTGSEDPDYLIIGDLNSYAMEDPIVALKNAGYTDLVQEFVGPMAYGYVFDGRWGTLDYAMANGSLTAQVTGVTEWHINADEPDALDYDESFSPSAWYLSDGFRSSDHDPVIVGLNLIAPPKVKDDCKKGGWQRFVDAHHNGFRNQGQCIQFINTGAFQPDDA